MWEGGKCLQKTPILKASYEELRDFFCTVLRVENETLSTVERELGQVEASDDLDYIVGLFKAITSHTEKTLGHISVDVSLKTQKIFPITTTVLAGKFESLESGLGNESWFIADRHHLRQSFDGVVPLLAFGVDDIGRMAPALRAMGLHNRFLSERVEDTTSVQGNVRLHPRYTAYLRRKAKFIAR